MVRAESDEIEKKNAHQVRKVGMQRAENWPTFFKFQPSPLRKGRGRVGREGQQKIAICPDLYWDASARLNASKVRSNESINARCPMRCFQFRMRVTLSDARARCDRYSCKRRVTSERFTN